VTVLVESMRTTAPPTFCTTLTTKLGSPEAEKIAGGAISVVGAVVFCGCVLLGSISAVPFLRLVQPPSIKTATLHTAIHFLLLFSKFCGRNLV